MGRLYVGVTTGGILGLELMDICRGRLELQLTRGGGRGGGGGGEEGGADFILKPNNPNLKGGEINKNHK